MSIYVSSTDEDQDDIHSLIAEHVLNQASIPVSFRMKSPVVPFIGRVSEISELRWAHVDKKMVVLAGPRGVGKSELAKKYAQDIKVDNRTSTLWIDSETHSSLIDAFKDLALSVGLKIENKEVTSIIKTVIDHFNNRKTLFIFDNAGDDNILVNNLPVWVGKSKFISVIVTSRSENWDDTKFKVIKINPFTIEESKVFIKTVIQKQINLALDDASCEKLASTLRYIPLALSSAVKDIIKKNYLSPSKPYTIEDFLATFQEPIITTITEVRGPTPGEIEDALSSKLKEEWKRVGDKITDEAKRVGHSVKNEAKRFEKRLKKWFG